MSKLDSANHDPKILVRARFLARRPVWVLCAVLLLSAPAFWKHSSARENGYRLCKYSVRDVGFVDVHPFSWQLTLAKPAGITPEQLEKLDDKVQLVLKESNLHHVWVERDSPQWNQLAAKPGNQQEQNMPMAVLSNSNGERFELWVDGSAVKGNDNELIAAVEKLVDSPYRQKILLGCSQSLCTLVMIESGNEAHDKLARELLDSAVTRLEKQMWELEKPTEKPPTGVVIPSSQSAGEQWLLNSLGMKPDRDADQPLFAILYGHGRRLGELIPLKDATLEKLVGRSAVCGGDCECNLDRDWLYGHQIVYRWSSDLELTAEPTLTFDAHAAYVKSEVAAIVRKSGRKPTQNMAVDFGPGLIIHDLEPLTKKNDLGKSKAETGGANPSELSTSDKLPNQPEKNIVKQGDNFIEGLETSDDEEGEQPVIRPPVSLMVILLIVGVGVVIWTMKRGN